LSWGSYSEKKKNHLPAQHIYLTMKSIRLAIPVFLFICILFLSIINFRIEQKKRILKEDLIELNLIKYGLFSVDEWKHTAASIIAKKIGELKLTGENKAVMQRKISAFLHETIDDFEARFYEERSRSIKGFIQGGVASLTGTFKMLKQDIPVFTEQIIAFLDDPQSKEAIKIYLSDQLDEYTQQTFAQVDYTRYEQILATHAYDSRDDALVGLKTEIVSLENESKPYKTTLIILFVITGLFLVFRKISLGSEFMIYIGICIVLIIPGVLLPMIEIDARISTLSFSLLGEQISFQDQVLFYQSKSILEVVQIMFEQKGADLIPVGILILAFSVIFPAAKLIASILYIYSTQMKKKKFIHVLIFHTGKWSMADVMVIAIFMAYIGFNGIIAGQLNQLESLAGGVDVLTTNESGILAGLWFFTAFVILSLIISQKLHSNKMRMA
jgi:hypothetical protein